MFRRWSASFSLLQHSFISLCFSRIQSTFLEHTYTPISHFACPNLHQLNGKPWEIASLPHQPTQCETCHKSFCAKSATVHSKKVLIKPHAHTSFKKEVTIQNPKKEVYYNNINNVATIKFFFFFNCTQHIRSAHPSIHSERCNCHFCEVCWFFQTMGINRHTAEH